MSCAACGSGYRQETAGELRAAALPIVAALTQHVEPRLRQVLLNLISNALRFADPEEPRVRIGAREIAENGKVWIEFAVSDNGLGIAPEFQQRVWQALREIPAGATATDFRAYDARQARRLLSSVPALEHVATYDFTGQDYQSFSSITSLSVRLTLDDGDSGGINFDTNDLTFELAGA